MNTVPLAAAIANMQSGSSEVSKGSQSPEKRKEENLLYTTRKTSSNP
jgi:hypothetical protein